MTRARVPVNENLVPDSGKSRRRALAAFAGLLGGLVVGCSREPEAERPWSGARFPAFALPGLDGTLHDSARYAGRPLLVNMWATWCPPCRAEMADLETLHARLAPRGLGLLAVSVDADANLVREYVRKEKLSFTILLDPDQHWAATALRVPGFPTTYLVGRDGVIREALMAPRAWADEAMLARVAKTLEL